jgi:hypothetical protein
MAHVGWSDGDTMLPWTAWHALADNGGVFGAAQGVTGRYGTLGTYGTMART